jgi:hypothetical protein
MHKQVTEGKNQVELFTDSARELGCDESEARFDRALRTIAPHPKRKRT